MNEIPQIASSGCLPVKPADSTTKRVVQVVDVVLGIGYLLGGAFLISTGGWFLVAAGVSLVAVGFFRLVAPKLFTSGTGMMLAGAIGIITSLSTAGIPFLVVGCVLLGLGLLRKLDLLGNLSQLYDGLCAWHKRKALEPQAQKSLEVFTNALVNFEVKNFKVKDELSLQMLIQWIGSFSHIAIQMYQQYKEPKILNLVEQMARLYARLSGAKNWETVSQILDEECFLKLLTMLNCNAQFSALVVAVAEAASSKIPTKFLPFVIPRNEIAPAEKAPASRPPERSHYPLYRNEIHQLNTVFNNHYHPALVVLGAAAYSQVVDPEVQKFVKTISSLLPQNSS